MLRVVAKFVLTGLSPSAPSVKAAEVHATLAVSELVLALLRHAKPIYPHKTIPTFKGALSRTLVRRTVGSLNGVTATTSKKRVA